MGAKSRLLLWLGLLLAVGWAALAVVTAHQTGARGLPDSFPAPVRDADVPILGVNVALEQYDDAELDAMLARIAAAGFAWVRQPFYWRRVEQESWADVDCIMAALARHPQLRLLAVLDDDLPSPPPDPDRFAAFAAAFAARYGAQVDYYQVWDEPNLAAHWGGGPVNPPAYADLLARSARAIRAADPGARIILAGLAPTVETGPQNLSDVRYLEQLYQAGAAPYFDIVSGKPYGFDTGPADRRADEATLNFSRLLLLREVMVEHGDADKALWASHWGWNALPPGWAGAPSLWGQTDAETQAARTVAALERARAEWPWAGAMVLDCWQPPVPLDDPRWGFALLGPGGAPRPLYSALAAWAAALPDAAPVGGYPAQNRWANYEGDWRVGPLGADSGSDGDRAVFRFTGSAVALTVRRGPYPAFLYVTVDGAPANALPRDEAGRAYVVLYDDRPAVAAVPLATGLPPGAHTVEIVTKGGAGKWSLVDWRVGAAPLHDGYVWQMSGLALAGLILLALLVRDVRRVEWGAWGRIFRAWPEWAQAASVTGLTGLLWITAANSWGVPHPSVPCFLLSLLIIPALTALLALRPDLGLALVAFTAPFYMHPGNMLYRALSMPELLLLLCALARLSTCKLAHLQTCPLANLRTCALAHLQTCKLDFAVALLLLAALIAGAAAADKVAALFELRTVFLFPALYYVLLRLYGLDERAKWRIVDGLAAGAAGVALIGLAQYALGINVVAAEGGMLRLRAVYFSPNNVGLYLGRIWPLLLAVAASKSTHPAQKSAHPTHPCSWNKRRLLYTLALAAAALAVGLSLSRGALLLGVPAALLAMGWRAGGRYRLIAVTLLLVGLLALMPLLRLPRFGALLDLHAGSTFFRLKLWHSTLVLIREHPWFGVGPGNFLAAYRTRYVLPSAWQEFDLGHPHNIYLDHWTRLGLLGLLAGAMVQVSFWCQVRWRPRRDPLTLGLVGGMAALLAHGLVDNALFYPDLALTFFLMLALL